MTGEELANEASAAPRTVPLIAAIGLVAGVVVLSLIVISGIVAISERRLPSGPAAAPPAAPAVTSIDFDEATLKAQAGLVSVTMPEAPFICDPPQEKETVFAQVMMCQALVHKAYNDAGDAWLASVVFGTLQRQSDDDSTLEDIASEAVRDVQAMSFSTEIEFEHVATGQWVKSIPVDESYAIAGEVHYKIKGLPSTYDRMVLIARKLPSGEIVVFITMRPSDTPKATHAALQASLDSLKLN